MLNGTPREGVGRALVELAGEPPVAHVELEQAVAGGERHPVEVGRVPGRDDQAAGIGIAADLAQHPGDLIDGAAAGLLPGAPLLAVDRAEVAGLVRPLVPDRHAVRPQGGHVGVPREEPEQFVNDRAQVQPLGGDQREARRQVEAHLMAEHRERAGAGAVLLDGAHVEDAPEQVVISVHRPFLRAGAAPGKRAADICTAPLRAATAGRSPGRGSTSRAGRCRARAGRCASAASRAPGRAAGARRAGRAPRTRRGRPRR